MGEHAIVERSSRGAPLAEPGEEPPLARPFFSRTGEGFFPTHGEIVYSEKVYDPSTSFSNRRAQQSVLFPSSSREPRRLFPSSSHRPADGSASLPTEQIPPPSPPSRRAPRSPATPSAGPPSQAPLSAVPPGRAPQSVGPSALWSRLAIVVRGLLRAPALASLGPTRSGPAAIVRASSSPSLTASARAVLFSAGGEWPLPAALLHRRRTSPGGILPPLPDAACPCSHRPPSATTAPPLPDVDYPAPSDGGRADPDSTTAAAPPPTSIGPAPVPGPGCVTYIHGDDAHAPEPTRSNGE
ncbi:vegetative cell wall protein gp1-like [Miscanthus floridulus]|uniref:vegetative cell wall protein gp1-like n=1 Tax=Miscanthus floridulus TaxID=154761 RepID=UPI00345839CC